MSYSDCITEAQKEFLDQFTCQRLKKDKTNEAKLEKFESEKGAALVEEIRKNGWKEDIKGSTAHYVIKNTAGEIVGFFALKCGILFDPDYYQMMRSLYDSDDTDAKDKDLFNRLVLCPEEEFDKEMFRVPYQKRRTIRALRNFVKDREEEHNKKIVPAQLSHSAIQLVSFCIDDNAKKQWADCGMGGRKMGETLFWWFVVPKMLDVAQLAGYEYVYTFVPAAEYKGKLMQYCEDVLHFQKFKRLGTFKSDYFMLCYFMCRRLLTLQGYMIDSNDVLETAEDRRGLDHYRKMFLAHFNEPVSGR